MCGVRHLVPCRSWYVWWTDRRTCRHISLPTCINLSRVLSSNSKCHCPSALLTFCSASMPILLLSLSLATLLFFFARPRTDNCLFIYLFTYLLVNWRRLTVIAGHCWAVRTAMDCHISSWCSSGKRQFIDGMNVNLLATWYKSTHG